MTRKGTSRTGMLVTRLVELGTRTLMDHLGEVPGITEQQAATVMREVAHNLAREWGGSHLYIPKDNELALTRRDIEIYERAHGGNINELAMEYRLSRQQVYSICRLVRERQIRSRQAALPGIEG